MRMIAALLLASAATALTAAPAPFLARKPRPMPPPANPHWVVDFSALKASGTNKVEIRITVRTPAGASMLSVGQGGPVNVDAIIVALSRAYFDKADLANDLNASRMTIKSHKGKPITDIELTMTGPGQQFAPVVTRPGANR